MLEFTYSTVGQNILKQKQGCPIGGILSSFYANLYCAKQEYDYITKNSLDRKDRIYGIRQVDDLVMWVAFDRTRGSSQTEAEEILREMFDKETQESSVYSHGLTIEEEGFELVDRNFQTDFAGTVISGNTNAELFGCTTLNKNWESLQSDGIQKKARYPPAISYIHDRTKLGVIIGSILRIATQNTTESQLLCEKCYLR